MKRATSVLGVITVAAAVLMGSQAQAQATRTWVSGVGDDVNPCSRTAPCKTYAGAISKTAAGGEISTLDPGGFGAVTITKSITINGDEQIAGVLAAGTNGIIVNAGATDKVVLRNLDINGANTGFNGIRFLAGAQLIVERCTIQQFKAGTGRGIDISMADVAGTTIKSVIVRNSLITDNLAGIRVNDTSADDFQVVTIVNSTIVNSAGIGVESAAGNGRLNISKSQINNNGTDGVRTSGAGAQITLEDNVLSNNNGSAVNAFIAGSRIRLANNLIVNNTTSISIAAGAFVESTSPASNRVAGNAGGVAPNAVFTQQ